MYEFPGTIAETCLVSNLLTSDSIDTHELKLCLFQTYCLETGKWTNKKSNDEASDIEHVIVSAPRSVSVDGRVHGVTGNLVVLNLTLLQSLYSNCFSFMPSAS